MEDIVKDVMEIFPNISPEQLDDVVNLIWKFTNEYASYVEQEAVSSAMDSLARYGR